MQLYHLHFQYFKEHKKVPEFDYNPPAFDPALVVLQANHMIKPSWFMVRSTRMDV